MTVYELETKKKYLYQCYKILCKLTFIFQLPLITCIHPNNTAVVQNTHVMCIIETSLPYIASQQSSGEAHIPLTAHRAVEQCCQWFKPLSDAANTTLLSCATRFRLEAVVATRSGSHADGFAETFRPCHLPGGNAAAPSANGRDQTAAL